jgi:hypothetical protein
MWIFNVHINVKSIERDCAYSVAPHLLLYPLLVVPVLLLLLLAVN